MPCAAGGGDNGRAAVSEAGRHVERGAGAEGSEVDTDAAPQRPSVSCPYLGLLDDPATSADHVRRDHVCLKGQAPGPVHPAYQAAFCLHARFQGCQVFRGRRDAPPPPSRSLLPKIPQIERRKAVAIAVFVVVIPAVLGAVVALIRDGGDAIAPTASPGVAVQIPDGTDASDEAAVEAGSGVAAAGASEEAEAVAEGTVTEGRLDPLDALRAWPEITERVVEAGDSLGALASEFGTTVEAIAAYNGIEDAGSIVEGQLLQIPVGFTIELPAPPPAETDGAVAGGGVPELPPEVVEELLAWPDLVEREIRPGDSLFALALEFGTTVEAIAVYNGLTNSDRIDAGTVITIPVGFTFTTADEAAPDGELPDAEAPPEGEPPEGDPASEEPTDGQPGGDEPTEEPAPDEAGA